MTHKGWHVVKPQLNQSIVLVLSIWHNNPASVAQFDARPTVNQEVAGSILPFRQHAIKEIDYEIFSTVILVSFGT